MGMNPLAWLRWKRFGRFREQKQEERAQLRAKRRPVPHRALTFQIALEFRLYPDGKVMFFPHGDGVEHAVKDEALKQLVYAFYKVMAEEARTKTTRRK